ncbi:hypothetical protein PV326_012493 [Microctonus aethiopoides]|nr:hypothetical protein PV326_012493 [Microctonus aethiopoides]
MAEVRRKKENIKVSEIAHDVFEGARSIHAGQGCTALNKLLSCLNVPNISLDEYKRYERLVGPAIEEAAKDSCRQGALEEKKLIIQRVGELCGALSPEIITDIYPHLNIFEFTNNNTACDISLFDTGVGEIVTIIISYDMERSKRGNGRSYERLNGYDTHKCRKNFSGSAKAMEPSVGSQLIKNSCILREAGLKVKVVIGHEDSSTMAAGRRGNDEKIHKLADSNHLRKNFSRDLYNLRGLYGFRGAAK